MKKNFLSIFISEPATNGYLWREARNRSLRSNSSLSKSPDENNPIPSSPETNVAAAASALDDAVAAAVAFSEGNKGMKKKKEQEEERSRTFQTESQPSSFCPSSVPKKIPLRECKKIIREKEKYCIWDILVL